MRRILTLVVAFVVAASLAACGEAPEQVSTAPTASTSTSAAAPTSTTTEGLTPEQREFVIAAWAAAANRTTTTLAPTTTTAPPPPPTTTTPPPATTTPPTTAHSPGGAGGVTVEGIVVCNGADLPTCAIVRRESGFNPRARNPSSSAAGLYQFLDSTFRGVCPEAASTYGSAANAPVSVQVACARILWDNGRGAGHWAL